MVRLIVLTIMVVVAAFMMTGCPDEEGLIVGFESQNKAPHRNSISLQPGNASDEFFDVIVRLGNKGVNVSEKETDDAEDNEDSGLFADELVVKESLPYLLVDVRRVSFTLEWMGKLFDFRLEWEPGNYFETIAPGATVDYVISPPYVTENGMTQMSVDISIPDNDPHIINLPLYHGNLVTLKFRGLRTAQVPLNFAGKWGDVFNADGDRISGISWYEANVTIIED